VGAIAISAEELGKRYQIGRTSAPYGRLTESLWRGLNAPVAIARRRRREAAELIWALHHVSFEVGQGEIIGVIGRNGAGKSTLLKILSRITEPTEGRVVMRGRVGCLLEVGTGFHPELTGRENVFMSGAILGMKREEINRKFDEIIDFSGVERFLDTPVKHYSSGMQVRLGFAVAAHMETEILIIDEVLAVGDAAFQAKCIGKMGDVSHEGRTIVFVSHDMAAITRLCPSALLIDTGTCTFQGPTADAIAKYVQTEASRSGNEEL
jgi:lipopolysaccharide transport system ATP-binding protein